MRYGILYKKVILENNMNAPISTLTSKGQVTIPKDVRDSLHLLSGDKVEFVRNDAGEIIIKPLTKKATELAGLLSKYTKPKPVSVEMMNQLVKDNLKKTFK